MISHRLSAPLGKAQFAAHTCSFAGAEESVSAIVGPPAALLGWIPYFSRASQLPDCFLRQRWEAGDEAVPLVLRSGNPQPPEDFPTRLTDFQRFVEQKHYRGALAVDQPTLFLDALRRPILLQFSGLAVVGATPMRGSEVSERLESLIMMSGGCGQVSGLVQQGNLRVTIHLFVRMKLNLLGQIAARIQTKSWPPWANLRVAYTLDWSGSSPFAEIEYHGTSVPSQARYCEWKKISEYSMETELSVGGYESFVFNGGCKDALPLIVGRYSAAATETRL